MYRKTTVAVGSFPANAWGLHDMHGNVWEWCHDLYGTYPEGPAIDPAGASDGLFRVNRGGSWYSLPANCRSAERDHNDPEGRYRSKGLRLVMTP